MKKQALSADHRKLSKTELNEGKAERSSWWAWCLLVGNRMGTKSNIVNHLHCPCCCYYLRTESSPYWLAMWHLGTAAAPSHAVENIPETRTRPPKEPPPSPLHSPQPLSLEEGISCHPTSCSGNCTSHFRTPHLSAFQPSASRTMDTATS